LPNLAITYFYTIGGGYQGFRGLGIEKIVKYLSAFGFGKETGIDLPGETNGLLPTPEWKKKNMGRVGTRVILIILALDKVI